MLTIMSFDPVGPAIGGAFIGLGAALLMLLIGRLAGVGGILGEALAYRSKDRAWRAAFLLGLVVSPILAHLIGFSLPAPQVRASWPVVIGGGLLVGAGARLGSGCTSGHGMCGVACLSRRSLLATALFMGAAIIVVAVGRHGIGG